MVSAAWYGDTVPALVFAPTTPGLYLYGFEGQTCFEPNTTSSSTEFGFRFRCGCLIVGAKGSDEV